MPSKRREGKESRAGGLSCREAQGLIRSYVDGTIRDRNLHRFIAHVRGCPACYSELETNFMVDRTVRLLDDDSKDLSFDLVPMLENDLNEREQNAFSRSRLGTAHKVILLITIALIVFLLLDLTGIFHVTSVL